MNLAGMPLFTQHHKIYYIGHVLATFQGAPLLNILKL